MEARTGTVLYEREAYRRRPPASTTKILTASIALERLPLTAETTISRRAAATPGSSAHLRPGTRYTIGELLKGLLLRSGNDAAAAIAERVAGDERRFAERMNEEANLLGAFASHFVNPHGLSHEDHFVSAHDLALLAAHALRDPRFRAVVSQAELPFGAVGETPHLIHNTNRLLSEFPGAVGVKTGTTAAAGRCLVAAAERDGLLLVSVVLHSPDRFGESARLLEYGFHNFRLAEGLRAGQEVRDARGRRLGRAEAPLMAVVPKDARVGVIACGRGGRARAFLLADGRPVAVVRLVGPELTQRGLPRWVTRLFELLQSGGQLES